MNSHAKLSPSTEARWVQCPPAAMLYIYREDNVPGDSFDMESSTDLDYIRKRADYYLAHLTRSERKRTNCYIVGFKGFQDIHEFYEFCENDHFPDPDYYEEVN